MIEVFAPKKGKVKTIPRSGKIWVNLINPSDEEIQQVGKRFNLHPLTVEDLEHRAPRIKVEHFPKYLFCVFKRAVNTEIRNMFFIIGKNFIMSMSRSGFDPIDAKLREALFSKGPAWIFHHILDVEVDKFIPYVTTIEKAILQMEEKAFEAHDDVPRKILSQRQKVSIIKNHLVNQHERIVLLLKQEAEFIPEPLVPYMRDVYDHAHHAAMMAEGLRDNLRSVYETYQSTVSQNMNNVMKVLSIIATLMLPLTVISGIWGTNFVNLPGKDNYFGFWIMCGLMVLLCLGMLWYFKKKKWF